MASPRNDSARPYWKDIQSMLTPVAIGLGIELLLALIYSFVRFA